MDGELVPGGRDEDLKGKGGVDVRGGGVYLFTELKGMAATCGSMTH